MPGHGSLEDSLRARRWVLLAFGLTLVYFTGVFPPWSNPNEISRLQTVVAMGEWGTFSIDRAVALLGDHEDKSEAGGRFYSNKAPGLAFAAYPVYRVLRLLLPPPDAGTANAIFFLLRLLTVSAACVLALSRLAVRLSKVRAGVAPLVLLGAAFGTPLLFYARSFFSHAWAASLLFLAWDRLRRTEEEPARRTAGAAALSGLLAGWAAISEYTAAPIAAALLLRAAARPDRRRAVAFALGAAPALLLLAGYNTVCFGSPWTLSSAREAAPQYAELAARGAFGFGLPSAKIALAYLFDPARGVLALSPFLAWSAVGLVRWFRSREERADCLFVVGSTAVFFVLLTAYPNWHGGWALGSRYLLPALFFVALPIARALETPLSRGLFLAAVTYSVAGHALATASFVHLPPELAWPAVNGSLWFLARGWAAPNLGLAVGLAPLASLAPPVLATAWAAWRAAAVAGPFAPAASVAALIGVAPLVVLSLLPPRPAFGARLWRASVFGAFSGRDPAREELRATVLEAVTPREKRLAAWAWRVYGRP